MYCDCPEDVASAPRVRGSLADLSADIVGGAERRRFLLGGVDNNGGVNVRFVTRAADGRKGREYAPGASG